MTDVSQKENVKAAVNRLRETIEDLEDELARVRARLETVERELGHAQYVAALKVQEVAAERDKLREELESARRIIDDLGVACEDEVDLPELETLIVQHKRRFGGAR